MMLAICLWVVLRDMPSLSAMSWGREPPTSIPMISFSRGVNRGLPGSAPVEVPGVTGPLFLEARRPRQDAA
jgi:hypothetical protein